MDTAPRRFVMPVSLFRTVTGRALTCSAWLVHHGAFDPWFIDRGVMNGSENCEVVNTRSEHDRRSRRCRSLCVKSSRLFMLLTGVGLLWGQSWGSSTAAQAQLIPDATLPQPSIVTDQVTPTGTTQQITGGTPAGANLFHSFEQFIIPAGGRAEFVTGGGVERIFSRVTGGQAAQIEGTLASSSSASLYLLAPQGVMFGEAARLDLGGDLSITTADRLDFADGLSWSAAPITDAALLSVDVPTGLGLGSPGGAIVNRSQALNQTGGQIIGLSLATGRSAHLNANLIQFDGGYLTIPDGELTLTTSSSSLDRPTDRPIDRQPLTTSSNSATGLIEISNAGRIDVSGDRGGSVAITADTLRVVDGARILADTRGSLNGQTTTIDVDRLEILNDALISVSTFGSGTGGILNVNAPIIQLVGTGELQDVLPVLFALTEITDPAQIGSGLFAMSLGNGNAGQLNVQAATVTLNQSAFMAAVTTGAGNGGTLNIKATDLIELSGSEIFADTYGSGNGGTVNLQADRVRLVLGGGIFASTFNTGLGGRVNVTADVVEAIGTTPNNVFNSGIGSNAFSRTRTEAGIVTLQARQLFITDGAGLGAGTFGPSRGGTLIFRVDDLIELSGTSTDGRSQSNITTQSRGTGEAGDIELTTSRLRVLNGASVLTSALDQGAAGRLTIRADAVEVSGRSPDGQFPSSLRSDAQLSGAPSGFFPPSVANVVGAAGDLTILAQDIRLRDGGTILVSSTGSGEQAGNLTLRADQQLLLDSGAQIQAETATAIEGNLSITAGAIALRRQSEISSNATGIATGGNIIITADTLVGLENSDITANAETGTGGRVVINADGVLGLTFRDRQTPDSDITATSNLGVQFGGIVEIRSPDLQLDSSLVELSANFAPLDQVVADSCLSRSVHSNNQFVMIRDGSRPFEPGDALPELYYLFDPVMITSAAADAVRAYDMGATTAIVASRAAASPETANHVNVTTPIDSVQTDSRQTQAQTQAQTQTRSDIEAIAPIWQVGDPIQEALHLIQDGDQLYLTDAPPLEFTYSDMTCKPLHNFLD